MIAGITHEGCSSVHHLSGTSGGFTSLNYPSDYENSKTCAWEITVPDNKVIHLWFVDFHVETSILCTEDRVTVEDNLGTLGTYCGSKVPRPLVSVGNRMFVTFITNSETSVKGFEAKYEAVDPSKIADHRFQPWYKCKSVSKLTLVPVPPVPAWSKFLTPPMFSPNSSPFQFHQHNVLGAVTSLGLVSPATIPLAYIIGGGGILDGNTGEFQSPSSTRDGNDVLYQWKITVAHGHRIKLYFTEFDLEPAGPAGCKELIEVYDGDAKGSEKIGQFCGKQIPDPVVTTWNTMVVHYRFNEEGVRGVFHAKYIGFQGNVIPTESPTTKSTTTGSTTTKSTTTGSTTTKSTTTGSTTTKSPTTKSTTTGSTTTKSTTTGSTTTKSTTTTTTVATVATTPHYIESGCDSNALQEGRKGFIHSKNYPDTYPSDLLCIWNISVTPGRHIKLTFTELAVDGELGSCIDKLDISDSFDVIGSYCGYLKPPVIISSSNQLFLSFSTDKIRTDRGFEAKWEEVHPEDIEEIQSCGGSSTEESGVIKSPNWPNNYAPIRLCVWHLEVPQEKKMTLKFTHFDLEDPDFMTRDCYDYVAAYEESSGKTVKYGPFCGTNLPDAITSQSNIITVRFYSDLFTESKGFRAYWSTDPLQAPPTVAPPVPNPWDSIAIDWPTKCGQPTYRPQINSRIVNGEPAIPHTWPWQVSMQVISRNETIFFHTCGATLIHKNWVLTAAHCFINYADELYRWQMCLGKHNLTIEEPTEKCYKILGIYRHEGFVYPEIPALEFDIALVKLDGEVVASDVIDFACLPPHDQVLSANYRCHATGWGDETGNSLAPKAAEGLNQVALPVISYEVCKTPQYWWFQIKESMICAGYVLPDELKSVCQGDSGGPLLCPSTTNSSIWEVHGITSFGAVGCVVDKKPSVFTRASAHLDWIDGIMKKDIYDIYSSGCGSAKDLSDKKGSFTSMRYPSTYSNDARCSWSIVAPADKVIYLHFNNFLLEESTNCNNDKVAISDELGSLGAHCGESIPSDLVSYSNTLSVSFTSNNRVVDAGFSASWDFVDPVTIPDIASCGGVFSTDKGELMSPNWPNSSYPLSHVCTWKITVDPGKQIHIVFTNFMLQIANLLGICQDYVEVFDGDKAGAVKLGQFCGLNIPEPLNTTGNVVVIKFISNHERNARGFYGYWTTNLTDIPSEPLWNLKPWDHVIVEWPANCDPQSKSSDVPVHLLSSQWHVSIQSRSRPYLPFQHRCAGSLINSQWILLAAHCMDINQELESLRVCFGSEMSQKCVGTDAFIRHEEFSYPQSNDHSHDIALLHLSEKVSHIQPVCLPHSGDISPPTELCYWTGWAAATGGPSSVTSKARFHVPVPVMSYESCSQSKFWQSQLTASMVCAGFESPEKLKSSCRGEAEGALHCKSAPGTVWEVKGIASFGPKNCMLDRKPQVFTRVSSYREWVVDKIKKYTYEKTMA
ncbi:ovochymase-2-like [Pseudophryne corroboree]|uniref:ovochymase-2-like n=1 Tax=Pseudophryne corroboree TaxID=495146 RepID=UPI003081D2D5